jgi:hypothetical protein
VATGLLSDPNTKIASSFSAEQMDVAAMDVKAVAGFLRGLSLDKVRAFS